MRLIRLAGVVALVLVLSALHARAEEGYRITDLGVVGNWEAPGAVNEAGQVALDAAGGVALWSADEGFRGIYHASASAYDLNDLCQIVGELNGRACRWDDWGNVLLLEGLAPWTTPYWHSRANAINNLGVMAGAADLPMQGQHACLWTPEGSVQDLGVLEGDFVSEACDINDSGQVVGWSGVYYRPHAFLWAGGPLQGLGALTETGLSSASAINNLGVVAGGSNNRAVVWEEGAIRELPSLPGGTSSYAYGINDLGQVVGTSGGRACLWTEAVEVLDLNGLIASWSGWELTEARDINGSGQIICLGQRSSGTDNDKHTLLLNPGQQALAASLTVAPAPLNLATTKDLFTCVVNLPEGHSTHDIDLGTVRLSLPDCPGCGEIRPTTFTVITEYTFQFKRSFLRQVPCGEVELRLTGLLNDGTPFEGAATVETWKPVVITGVETADALGRTETQFAAGEPIVLSCGIDVDRRAGERLKALLVVQGFGRVWRGSLPVSPGQRQLGYTLVVPAGATPGPQELKVSVQLKKRLNLLDTAITTVPIEVLEHSKIDWQL